MIEAEAVSNLAQVERLYSVLRDLPADGQFRTDDQRDVATDLIVAGYIERRISEKACPTCGTPKVDHRWFHITGGGRLFMEAMAALHSKQEEEG